MLIYRFLENPDLIIKLCPSTYNSEQNGVDKCLRNNS